MPMSYNRLCNHLATNCKPLPNCNLRSNHVLIPHARMYHSSMDFCTLCTRVFDRNDKSSMKFDDFIQCCVMLRSLTEGFKKLDTNRDGQVQINYEQVSEQGLAITELLAASWVSVAARKGNIVMGMQISRSVF